MPNLTKIDQLFDEFNKTITEFAAMDTLGKSEAARLFGLSQQMDQATSEANNYGLGSMATWDEQNGDQSLSQTTPMTLLFQSMMTAGCASQLYSRCEAECFDCIDQDHAHCRSLPGQSWPISLCSI